MDKAKYKKMYELANKLSQVDAASLNEQQLAERDAMIQHLQKIAQGVAEGEGKTQKYEMMMRNGQVKKFVAKDDADAKRIAAGHGAKSVIRLKGGVPAGKVSEQGVAEGAPELLKQEMPLVRHIEKELEQYGYMKGTAEYDEKFKHAIAFYRKFGNIDAIKQGVAEGRHYPSPYDYDSDIDYYAAVDRYLGKKGPRPGDDDWEETAPGDSFGDEDDEKTNEADAPRPTYNVMKLGGALDIDPRMLRVAITRGLQGQATRTDMSVLARSFLNMISNSDDKDIQYIANLIKTGNPRPMAQENTAAIAERNAFVNAMRNVKQGEKFSVGGKEYTKTTRHGEDKEVTENIDKEAYDRLKRVFDFSNFKGDV